MPDDMLENLKKIRESAKVIPFAPEPPPPDAPPPGDEGPAEEMQGALPPDCPVRPLGISGEYAHYLDEAGQLRSLKAKDHSRLNVQSLFGRRVGLLYDYWPRKTQDKETGGWKTTGWKPELGAETLMQAAAERGVWSPTERVRGGGAWVGDDGELILHVGDALLIADAEARGNVARPWREVPPGVVDGMVYPTAPPTLRPAAEPEAPGAKRAAQELLDLIDTWNLRRPEVDRMLLLGWIGAAKLGGALDWRAAAWLTGGYGTGKTSLEELLCWTQGEGGILHTADPSAAGIRQLLKHSSHPVAIDEAEAEEDGRRMQTLVKLARDAATGAISVRGGSDHEAATFTLRSCFLFGSILIPPLLPQDRSRIAIIELGKLPADAKPLGITKRMCAELGARLLHRLIVSWPRVKPTIELFRRALGEAGHSARGQDVFGTLLGIADVLLHNELPDSDSLETWKALMPAASLAETGGVADDAEACLAHLLTTSIESVNKGARETVGWWAARAAGIVLERGEEEIEPAARRVAQRTLNNFGLAVKCQRGAPCLAVAHKHTGLARIFDKTQWASRPGAEGVWRQSLDRLADRQVGGSELKSVPVWVGSSVRATLIPLTDCLPRDISVDAFTAAARRMEGESR